MIVYEIYTSRLDNKSEFLYRSSDLNEAKLKFDVLKDKYDNLTIWKSDNGYNEVVLSYSKEKELKEFNEAIQGLYKAFQYFKKELKN